MKLMRLLNISALYLQKIPLWLVVVFFVLAAIILHQIPHRMEVTLHLLTERLSFVLSGTTTPVPFLEGQPLTSLTLRGVARLPLQVQELRQGGRAFAPAGGRIVLQSRSKDASLTSLTFAGEGLRLIRLALAPGTQVGLSTDGEPRLLVDMQHSPLHHLELGMTGGFTLTVKEMSVRDAQDKELPLLSQPVQTLQVTPARRNLIFDQEEQLPSGLNLDFSRQIEPGPNWKLPLAFVPRLKLSSPDVTREDRNTRVSAVQELWIEPLLVPKEKPEPKVFLQVREDEVFTLQSVQLTARGLECELNGYTTTIMIGREKPLTNKVPSWFEYIVKHVIFQTVCKPAGIC